MHARACRCGPDLVPAYADALIRRLRSCLIVHSSGSPRTDNSTLVYQRVLLRPRGTSLGTGRAALNVPKLRIALMASS